MVSANSNANTKVYTIFLEIMQIRRDGRGCPVCGSGLHSKRQKTVCPGLMKIPNKAVFTGKTNLYDLAPLSIRLSLSDSAVINFLRKKARSSEARFLMSQNRR